MFFVLALVLLLRSAVAVERRRRGRASGALFVLEIGFWQRRVRRQKVATGAENLVGATGEATERLAPVGPDPRAWASSGRPGRARSFPSGTTRVRVTAIDGLTSRRSSRADGVELITLVG